MATTFTYANSFAIAGVGINGATVNAYKATRFGSVPAKNAAPPGGGADATATTGTAAGSDGGFTIALPTSEDYWISVTWAGTVYWLGPVSQMFEDGTGALGGLAGPGTLSPSVIASGVSRTVSATLNGGEYTVFSGSTASQILTLPGSTAQATTANLVANVATVPVTVAAGASTTLNFFGTVGSFILAPNTTVQLVLIGTVWFATDYTGFGVQVANNTVTANYTTACSVGGTTFAAGLTSGTAPTITLPNDNRIYRVEWLVAELQSSIINNQVTIGFGTAAGNLLMQAIGITSESAGGSATFVPPVVARSVVGTGQTLSCFVNSVAISTVTFSANLFFPSSLTAIRVA